MKDDCFLLDPKLKVRVVYIYVINLEPWWSHAKRFVQTYLQFKPDVSHRVTVICNGGPPSNGAPEMFAPLRPDYFVHDNSAYDIGAYQHFCQTCTDDMVVFLGASTYLRRAGWLERMVQVFLQYNGNGLFGAGGDMRNPAHGSWPHIRTTGFWCRPALMNAYPYRVTQVEQRYPFEHGPQSLTAWVQEGKQPAVVVDFAGTYDYPHWRACPNGYHKGDQRDLLVGDKVTEPPYYPHR